MKTRNILLVVFLLFASFRSALCIDTLFIKHQSDVKKIDGRNMKHNVIKFGNGTFFIPSLVFIKPIEILGEGNMSILKPVGSGIQILLRGIDDLKIKNIVIDGIGKASVGVYANKNLYISSCSIQNFQGNRTRAGTAIRTQSSTSRLIVENSSIKNISGYEDGIVGNSIGANRGVFSVGNYIRISNTLFENIVGKEDGDAIHFQTPKNKNKRWSNSNSVIENCRFINFGKRAIKLASSNNIVRGCYFMRDGKNPANVAIALYGDSNSILDNEFDIAVDVAWISFSGARFSDIRGNKVKMTKTSRLLHVAKTVSTTVKNNDIYLSNQSTPLTGFSSNTEKIDFTDLNYNNKIRLSK